MARKSSEGLNDEVLISMKNLAVLYNTGIRKMRILWRQDLRYRIRSVESSIGPRICLVDAMKTAYPDLNDQAIGLMCIDFTCRIIESRKRDKPEIKIDEEGE